MTTIQTTGTFTKEYFDNGLEAGLSSYDSYLSGGYRADCVQPKATAIVKATHLKAGDKVLDFGCAAGYFVYSYCTDFQLDAHGTDVSSDAIEFAPETIRDRLFLRQEKDISEFSTNEFDLVIAKDVLEHIPPQHLDPLISELRRIGKKLLISVPVTDIDGGAFIDPTDEQDPTHVIRLSRASWSKKLKGNLTELEDVCLALKGRDRLTSNLTALITK